jgi:hypothetical protein
MIKNNKPPIRADGIAILMDFERITYTANPANRQIMAVRVPEANIPKSTIDATDRKKILSAIIFMVDPNMKNATAVAAALHP